MAATDTRMDKDESKSRRKKSSSHKRKSNESQHSSSGRTPDYRWDLGSSSHHVSEFAEEDVEPVEIVKKGSKHKPMAVKENIKSASQRKKKSSEEKDRWDLDSSSHHFLEFAEEDVSPMQIVKKRKKPIAGKKPIAIKVNLKSAMQRKAKSPEEKQKLAISFSEKNPTPFYYPMDGDEDYEEENPMRKAMGLGADDFTRTWNIVLEKRLHNAAKIIQKWVKKWMISFIMMNDMREELYDELEAIEDRKVWEIESIVNFKEELMDEAKLDVELEMQENEDSEELVETSSMRSAIDTVKQLHLEVHEAKQERIKLKKEKEDIKFMKKALQYDLRQKTPCLQRIECKVQAMKQDAATMTENLKTYKGGLKKWEDGIAVSEKFLEREKRIGSLYRTCLWDVYLELENEIPESVIREINDTIRAEPIIFEEFEKLTTRQMKPALTRLQSVRVPRKPTLAKMSSVPILKS